MTTNCRFCGTPLKHTFVDLGSTPVANDLVTPAQAQATATDPSYPLHVYVCDNCWLVQIPNIRRENEIFTDNYPYFSSFSSSWLKHAKDYVDMMVERFNIGPQHQVVELASNDGYLLQYFKEKGVPVLGVEPTKNTAAAAQAKGIETVTKFFGADVAEELAPTKSADLLIGNNVLAHVPDLNDFVAGMSKLLKPTGILTMEFPHLMRLMAGNQFDTIYHEHYSYYSLLAVEKIFAKHGLTVFDVAELKSHGGSLRVFARKSENDKLPVLPSVEELKKREVEAGLTDLSTYSAFGERVQKIKRDLNAFIARLKSQGKSIIAYGAAAKGNTLLNFSGVKVDSIDYAVDANPNKQGHYLPGSRIPIYGPARIKETKPDYVLILPWNLTKEITSDHSYVTEWGGKFFVAIPEVKEL